MKILFLTIGSLPGIETRDLYPDLLRTFRDRGHEVYTVSPYEKRTGKQTELIDDAGAHMLHVRIGNITKCGMIEKGISTLQVESRFISAIKRYFRGVRFDLVLYSTPPITFAKVVRYIKRRDGARTYLLLKDIFPQNAVDLGVLSTRGPKALFYRFFRQKERRLYAISDRIGCMSEANVAFLLRHNPTLSPGKVELCPNAIQPMDMRLSEQERAALRGEYGLPRDRAVFVYGGNLGRPQGIPHLIDCMRAVSSRRDCHFLIVGSGTEYGRLERFVQSEKPQNLTLLEKLPKQDFDRLVAACDVGLIFLDHRFTIPNFPSRLLDYLQAGLPVLSCTDPNTDIGAVTVEGGFGFCCESNDPALFVRAVDEALAADLPALGQRGLNYLLEHYTVDVAYRTIMGEAEEKQ